MPRSAALRRLRARSTTSPPTAGRAERTPRTLARHKPDRFRLRHRLGVRLADEFAIAHDGHMRREAHDLVPSTRDEHDDRAVLAQALDEIDQPFDLTCAEGRGRFIQQQHLWPPFHSAHDFQHLLLAERQRAHRHVWRHRQSVATQHLARDFPPCPTVQAPPGMAWPVGQQEIILYGERAQQRQFLKDADNAVAQRVVCIAQRQLSAIERDMADGRLLDARDHLDEGRLASAVLADEAEQTAGPSRQTYRLRRPV